MENKILLICPFISDELISKYSSEMNFARTLIDVWYLFDNSIQINKVYLFPFLKFDGNQKYPSDINLGSMICHHIKKRYSCEIHILMQGDHHSEMFEGLRHLADYEECYLGLFDQNQEELIQWILGQGNRPKWNYDTVEMSSCLFLDSIYWKSIIKKIKNSKNINY